MKIRNIYLQLLYLMTLLIAFGGCDDYYSVDVQPGPGMTPVVTLSPEEQLVFTAQESTLTLEVLSNMPDSTISVAVTSEDDSWCKAEVDGNIVSVTVSENPQYISRSSILSVKVFSVTKTVEIVQEAKEFVTEPIYPITKTYKITLPEIADFEKSKIYKVMDGEQKIAEICLEYLVSGNIASRAVVVYAGVGSAADYENGYVAYLLDSNGNISSAAENGGKAIFNYEENSLQYIEGESMAASVVYLSSYGITSEEQSDAVTVVAEPYTVKDICGNEYPVVKIGTEVWLGTNLRTVKFGDGTEIPLVDASSVGNYANVPFATWPKGDSSADVAEYGLLYNAKVVMGNNEALIGSSIVDGSWRVATGGGSNDAGIASTATDWQRLFKYLGNDQLGAILATGYNWSNGGAGGFDINTVSNITGLGITPAGEYYSCASGFVLGADQQAFMFCGGGAANGYNFAEVDGKASDQAGVRVWTHANDACSIRMVRVDNIH